MCAQLNFWHLFLLLLFLYIFLKLALPFLSNKKDPYLHFYDFSTSFFTIWILLFVENVKCWDDDEEEKDALWAWLGMTIKLNNGSDNKKIYNVQVTERAKLSTMTMRKNQEQHFKSKLLIHVMCSGNDKRQDCQICKTFVERFTLKIDAPSESFPSCAYLSDLMPQ